METDEDYRLKNKKERKKDKTKRGDVECLILVTQRSDKDRQGRGTREGKMEADRTEEEQGGVRESKAMGGGGTY